MENLSEVKNKIAELYSVLSIENYQVNREQELLMRLENLKTKIEPLEKVGVVAAFRFCGGAVQIHCAHPQFDCHKKHKRARPLPDCPFIFCPCLNQRVGPFECMDAC